MPNTNFKRVPWATIFASAAGYWAFHKMRNDNFDSTELKKFGNSFANTVQQFDGISSTRKKWLQEKIRSEEGVDFQKNTSNQVLFRGEYNFDSNSTSKMLAESVMHQRKHPVIFSPRVAPFKPEPFSLNDHPTVGNPVLNGLNPHAPDNWTGGFVSHTSAFERALDYGNGGIIILSVPDNFICTADHIAKVKGEYDGREYEYLTPDIEPRDVIAVAEIEDRTIKAVHINEPFFADGREISGDKQLGLFVAMLNEDDPKQKALKQLLAPHIDSNLDYTKEYESREAQDIYELYSSTAQKLIVAYNDHYARSNTKWAGYFYNRPETLESFLSKKLPHLPTLLETRQNDEFHIKKVEDLAEQLKAIGVPQEVIAEKMGVKPSDATPGKM